MSNQSSQRHLTLCMLGLTGLLLSGCGPKQARNNTPPVIETAATPAAPAMLPPTPTSPQNVQISPTITLYGGFSQEEIDRLYETPQITNVAKPRTVQQPAPAVVESAVAPADPRWDVKLQRTWRHIVIHHSATDTGSADSFHRSHLARGWDGLGYHFVIGNGSGSGDGEVEIGYRWTKQQRGAHAGNLEYNEHGIGICLVGDFETGRPTQRQLASLRSLIRFLESKCGISTVAVIGHDDVPGKQTRCPGANFPMAAFKQSLSSTTVSAAPVRSTSSARTITYSSPNGAGCP